MFAQPPQETWGLDWFDADTTVDQQPTGARLFLFLSLSSASSTIMNIPVTPLFSMLVARMDQDMPASFDQHHRAAT
jgi:hypothetical protein